VTNAGQARTSDKTNVATSNDGYIHEAPKKLTEPGPVNEVPPGALRPASEARSVFSRLALRGQIPFLTKSRRGTTHISRLSGLGNRKQYNPHLRNKGTGTVSSWLANTIFRLIIRRFFCELSLRQPGLVSEKMG
jgi:hypothetical protein